MNWSDIDTNAKKWTREAGERIRSSFSQELMIHTKTSPDDLVTNIDRDTEQFLIEKIRETYPDHQILGEEGLGDKLDKLDGTVWIIDPIDGTMNFVHQQRNFAISVAVYEDGIGKIGLIYDVVHDELYHAKPGEGAFLNDIRLPQLEEVEVEKAVIALNATWVTENKRIDPTILAPLIKRVRGTRSYGSAALEMAYVATGRIDAYITLRLSPWDFAAGLIMVQELGGKVTTLLGEPLNLLEQNSVFVSKPGLHEEISKDYLSKLK
ncbi:inositol monophosphatase family protein [Sutcliffiella rhizosphaerae]|uniref:inositol-phosphate phosphatase n=1 Tax=Sutcliffiella rhizosphaerae TaxID=2880967 RepID=A0ABN8A7X3_9BACI|nr:inositol monophosphatase family protein [Sutcliffiella rhizosphaerae]CAG9619866.1 Fructose-1, 6-bisphosphatase/inositol-1-monophosphatase [Sutcliffiella rhizosphaerae]